MAIEKKKVQRLNLIKIVKPLGGTGKEPKEKSKYDRGRRKFF